MEPKKFIQFMEPKKLIRFKSYNKEQKSDVEKLLDSCFELSPSIVPSKLNKRMREATNLEDSQLEEFNKVEDYQENSFDNEDDFQVFDDAMWAVQSENELTIQDNKIQEEEDLKEDELDKIDEIQQAKIANDVANGIDDALVQKEIQNANLIRTSYSGKFDLITQIMDKQKQKNKKIIKKQIDDTNPLIFPYEPTKGDFARAMNDWSVLYNVKQPAVNEVMSILHKFIPEIKWPVNTTKTGDIKSSIIKYCYEDLNMLEFHVCPAAGCCAFVGDNANKRYCSNLYCNAERYRKCTHPSCYRKKYYECNHTIERAISWKSLFYRPILLLLNDLLGTSGFIHAMNYIQRDKTNTYQYTDISHGSTYKENINEMEINYNLKYPINYPNKKPKMINILLGQFYDGCAIFKNRYSVFWPFNIIILNLPPSYRIKLGQGMFLLTVLISILASNTEDFFLRSLLVGELNALKNGVVINVKGVLYFVQVRMILTILDTIAVYDFLKVKAGSAYTGCFMCRHGIGYRGPGKVLDNDMLIENAKNNKQNLQNAAKTKGKINNKKSQIELEDNELFIENAKNNKQNLQNAAKTKGKINNKKSQIELENNNILKNKKQKLQNVVKPIRKANTKKSKIELEYDEEEIELEDVEEEIELEDIEEENNRKATGFKALLNRTVIIGHRQHLDLRHPLRYVGQSQKCCPPNYYAMHENKAFEIIHNYSGTVKYMSDITKFHVCDNKNINHIAQYLYKPKEKWKLHHINYKFIGFENDLWYHNCDYRPKQRFERKSNREYVENGNEAIKRNKPYNGVKGVWAMAELSYANIENQLCWGPFHSLMNVASNIIDNWKGERIHSKTKDIIDYCKLTGTHPMLYAYSTIELEEWENNEDGKYKKRVKTSFKWSIKKTTRFLVKFN